MDLASYTPAPHVLDRLQQVDFVAVIGPTAVGKSTLITDTMRLDPSIHLVLNNTTRGARPGERDGVDYAFQTRASMEARIMQREYVQVAPSVLGELYATAPEGFAVTGVSVMAVLAQAMPNFRALPFRRCRSIFVIPPSWEVWQGRLHKHDFSPEQRRRRLAEAETSLEFALNDQQTTILISDDTKVAAQDFVAFALGGPLPGYMQPGNTQPRMLVTDLLANLRQELRLGL